MSNLTSWQETQQSWFLGIGINEYAEFPKLSNAVKDIREVKDVLVAKYDVDEEHVLTLFDQEATKENIIETLDELGRKVKASDKLFIYYSGHGHLNDHLGLGYWIPVDAQKNKAARYIPNSTVRDYVKGIKAKHILLVSDSCFSGSLFMQGQHRSSRAIKELDNLTSRWAICSGRHDEEVYDGDPGENSPFTKSFIDILNNNEQDFLNVGRIADRVIEQTASNYEQLPDGRPLFGVGHQGGQYIFKQKGTARSAMPVAATPVVDKLVTPETMTPPEAAQGSIEGVTVSKKMIAAIGAVVLALLVGMTAITLTKVQPAQIIEAEAATQSDAALTAVSIESEKSLGVDDKADPVSQESKQNTESVESNNEIPEKPKAATNQKKIASAQKVDKSKEPSKNVTPAVAAPLVITTIEDAVVELFELENYKGRSLKLYGDQFTTIENLSKIDVESMEFNDVISSAKIHLPEGYRFTLYEKKRFKGEEFGFTGTGKLLLFPTLGNLDDQVTSTRLERVK